MAKCLVTGGAGFIGSHTVEALLESGHEVAVVDNLRSGYRIDVHDSARFYELDIDLPDLQNIFQKTQADFVFHLAADTQGHNPLREAQTNVLGTINVLECCIKHGVKKIIYASTRIEPVAEFAVVAPLFNSTPPIGASHKDLTKWVGEMYVRIYQELHGLDYSILRYPTEDRMHVGDIAEANLLAMSEGKNATIDIGTKKDSF